MQNADDKACAEEREENEDSKLKNTSLSEVQRKAEKRPFSESKNFGKKIVG